MHIDSVVVVGRYERSVGRWWLRELFNFFAQGRNVLSSFTERKGQLLVLRNCLS